MPLRIVIPTSDKTIWCLPGCLAQLDRYWPQHPPVHIGGYSYPTFKLPTYATFESIGDFGDYPAEKWSDGLIRLMEGYQLDTFLFHMDDFWLTRPVPDALVRFLADYLEEHPELARIDLTSDRANNAYALTPFIEKYRHHGEWHDVNMVACEQIAPYMLSFQAGIWRRKALLAYLIPGETAGETEVRGSNRMTLAGANVLGTLEAPFKYKIVVQHGKVVIREPGYQVPPVALADEDLAELDALGYTTPPQGVTE